MTDSTVHIKQESDYEPFGATRVTYDGACDLTHDGTYTYRYDAEGRLTSVGGGAARSYRAVQ